MCFPGGTAEERTGVGVGKSWDWILMQSLPRYEPLGKGLHFSWVSVSTSVKWAGGNTYDLVKLGGLSKITFFRQPLHTWDAQCRLAVTPSLTSILQMKPLRCKERRWPAHMVWATSQIWSKPLLKPREGSNLSLAWVASSVKWVDRREGQIR